MLTITAAANARILEALDEQDIDAYGLRVAARYLESELESESGYEYVLGFDELRDGDEEVHGEGIVLLIARASQQAMSNLVMDYVAVDGEQMAFVFTPVMASAPGASCQTSGCNKKCSGG